MYDRIEPIMMFVFILMMFISVGMVMIASYNLLVGVGNLPCNEPLIVLYINPP